MTRTRCFISLVFSSLLAVSAFGADAVLDWNDQILNGIRLSRTPPPKASHALAIYHAAIYDAINGIERTHQAYHVDPAAPAGADPEAAAAEAARVTYLATLGKTTNPRPFIEFYNATIAAIPDGSAKIDGIAWGKHVAEQILKLREDDGISAKMTSVVGETPGVWRPTPPLFRSATAPHWAKIKPFAMTSCDQFRPEPPPAITSKEYADAVNEVKRIGGRESAERTEYETNSVVFWSDDLGTATPPGHWNVIAHDISEERGLSLIENARLFALLNIAAADAAIACWDSKFHYNFWRPEHAIREADSCKNPWIEADENFIPLMPSPTFPDYVSGHSTFSRTCSQILTRFFETDKVTFSTISEGFPGDVRTFQSFSEAAKEIGRSRVFGGIHFNFADINGQKCGKKLADYVSDNFLLPVDQGS